MPKRKPDRDAPEFGVRLVKLLEESGVPRRGAGAYLQRKYGVSNVTANDWLNGNFKPKPPQARRIADDHGGTFDSLYFGKPKDASKGKAAEAPDAGAADRNYRAISIALGALAATMVQHRPAEAAEAADALLATAPADLRDHELIRELAAVLEHAKSARRRQSSRAAS